MFFLNTKETCVWCIGSNWPAYIANYMRYFPACAIIVEKMFKLIVPSSVMIEK